VALVAVVFCVLIIGYANWARGRWSRGGSDHLRQAARTTSGFWPAFPGRCIRSPPRPGILARSGALPSC